MLAQTLIWRHRKERRSKCSLRGLENREDMRFFTYPNQALPPLDGVVLLTPNAPPLEEAATLLLLDATWRYAETMRKQLTGQFIPRSLPHWQTAYPRRQEGDGLASAEALFAAYTLLGWETEGLLNNYCWKAEFIEKNKKLLH